MAATMMPAMLLRRVAAGAGVRSSVGIRAFAAKVQFGEQGGIRIETKMGVGLRYRRPKSWKGGVPGRTGATEYTAADVKDWRTKHKLPKGQHSLGVVSYTDEELLEWRAQFDKFAKGEMISLSGFEQLVKDKLTGGELGEKEIPGKVLEVWGRFDKDQKNGIDFGDFMKADFLFNLERCKGDIERNGAEEVFSKYAVEGYIDEGGIFQLMEDHSFTVVSTTDVRKVMRMGDKDKDGVLGLSDFQAFLKSPTQKRHRTLDLPVT